MKHMKWMMLAAAILLPVHAFAVAPHPDIIKEWKENGTFSKKITELMARENKMAKKTISLNASVKKAATTGNLSIPVILMQFNGKSETSSNQWPLTPIISIILFLSIFGGLAYTLPELRRKRFAHAATVIAIIPGIFFCSPGCSSSRSGFQTSGTALFDSISTASYYQNIFDGSEGLTLNCKKYYQDMSDGKLNLSFDIYGPYTSEHSHDYYGSNDTYGNDSRPDVLTAEAVRKLIDEKNSSVDFSKYDNDSDGQVDGVIIVHQGRGEETTSDDADNNIWAHMWNIEDISADGVSFSKYSMQAEYIFEPGDSTIGVFCHEFGHILGLPDLYDYTGITEGVGNWSLMASGSWNGTIGNGDVPATLLAWERNKLGWLTYIEPATTGSTSVVNVNTSFEAVKIPLYTDTFYSTDYEQYMVVENIVFLAGSWTEYMPGEGLLVTKIDDWWSLNNGNYLNGNVSSTGTYYTIHGVNVLQSGGNSLWGDPALNTDDNQNNDVPTSQGESTDTFCSENPSTQITYMGSGTLTKANTNYTVYSSTTSFPLKGYTGSSGVTLSGFSGQALTMTFTYTKL